MTAGQTSSGSAWRFVRNTLQVTSGPASGCQGDVSRRAEAVVSLHHGGGRLELTSPKKAAGNRGPKSYTTCLPLLDAIPVLFSIIHLSLIPCSFYFSMIQDRHLVHILRKCASTPNARGALALVQRIIWDAAEGNG